MVKENNTFLQKIVLRLFIEDMSKLVQRNEEIPLSKPGVEEDDLLSKIICIIHFILYHNPAFTYYFNTIKPEF